jgi:hypothetical protein
LPSPKIKNKNKNKITIKTYKEDKCGNHNNQNSQAYLMIPRHKKLKNRTIPKINKTKCRTWNFIPIFLSPTLMEILLMSYTRHGGETTNFCKLIMASFNGSFRIHLPPDLTQSPSHWHNKNKKYSEPILRLPEDMSHPIRWFYSFTEWNSKTKWQAK